MGRPCSFQDNSFAEATTMQDTIERIRAIRPVTFTDRPDLMTEAEVLEPFRILEAYWQHNGDPTRPHALLTSGLHSNGFVNCGVVLTFTNLLMIYADQIVRRLWQVYDGSVDWVVGSNHAAVSLATFVAYLLGVQSDFPDKGPGKAQVWQRHKIPKDARVLQVEELMTTAFTAQQVREGIQRAHDHLVQFVPFMPVLIHRSAEMEVDGAAVVPVCHLDIENWTPEECPLCRQGSEAISPKTPIENWGRLLGR